jgi:spermidine synthase
VIACASAVLSFCFPIAHHLGTRSAGTTRGRHFARVYTANVMGAALGPLVTGYLLLDRLTLQSSFIVIAVMQAGAAIFLVQALRLPAARGIVAAAVAGSGGLVLAAAVLDPHALVRVLGPQGQRAAVVVENRHGALSIFRGDRGDDIVYGGNVYDGSTNLDPVRNTNGLERPLLLAALHPEPRRVLMIGLSVGTWLAVVREFPGVESIDVIEINPGYLQAAQAYPMQAAALRDPRVHVAVDDARRWLRHHPGRQYDVVVMNTTLHWRAHSTLLLSRQMLEQLKAHMAPGAVLGFNATDSPDAFFTASQVFAHAYRYRSFVYAAGFDFRPRKDAPRARLAYEAIRLEGRPFFPAGSSSIARHLAVPFSTVADDAAATGRALETVTDENLITEFRYGRTLYDWGDLFFFSDPLWLPARGAQGTAWRALLAP